MEYFGITFYAPFLCGCCCCWFLLAKTIECENHCYYAENPWAEIKTEPPKWFTRQSHKWNEMNERKVSTHESRISWYWWHTLCGMDCCAYFIFSTLFFFQHCLNRQSAILNHLAFWRNKWDCLLGESDFFSSLIHFLYVPLTLSYSMN